MRRVHAGFAALLLLLGLTALVPARPEVVDLLTGERVEGARLETIDPQLRTVLEPLYGPLHEIGGLPDQRIASWLVWIALAILAVRLVRLRRRGRLRAMWWVELLSTPGYYLLYAAVALPLIWVGVIPKRHLPIFLFAVPAAAVAVVVAILARRRGWRSAGDFAARCVGILGLLGLVYAAYVFVLPGTFRTGRRLVPPQGLASADFHAHAQKSQDAILGPDRRLEVFEMHGIGLSAVTEHGCFDDPEDGETATWGSMSATARSRNLNLTLLPGMEFTTHALHLVLLGIRRTYPTGHYRIQGGLKSEPPHYGYDYQRLIDDVHRDGGYVIVAHWWSHRQWDRVDWRLLVDYGVDGFEITSGPEIAPRELIEAWKATGKLLFAASDFHGWHKSFYGWNLVEVRDRDPYEIVHRIFRERRVRVVMARGYDPSVPAVLEPPAGAWRYFTGLARPNRAAWIGLTVLSWAIAFAFGRNIRHSPETRGSRRSRREEGDRPERNTEETESS